MWHQLSSPPQNLRFYRFSELSNEKDSDSQQANLEQHQVNLFKDDKLSSVAEESMTKTNGQQGSRQSNKPLSSLKSTNKVNSSANTSKTIYDLRLNCNQTLLKKHSKSQINGQQVQSTVLSSKNNHSSVQQKTQKNRLKSTKGLKNSQNSQKDIFLKSHENNYSDLIIREHKKTEENDLELLGTQSSLMLNTLIEIRDLTKENLIQHKKLIKMLEDKQQISFLYGQDKSEMKYFKPKRDQRKTFKRNPEKSSTIKQFGKSLGLDERVCKIQDKYRFLEKKLQKLELSQVKKTIGFSRMKKKSTSTLR